MVRKLPANGAQIKELRNNSTTPLPQKLLAEKCRISERKLRRIENTNPDTDLPTLQSIATELGVDIDRIAHRAHGPRLVETQNESLLRSKPNTHEPKTTVIPRHTTSHLRPVPSAQALYDLARGSMAILPQLLVDALPAQAAMIQECLSLLKTVSDQQWSCGKVISEDEHDGSDFPDISRRSRLAELFVLIKGHDIRIVAEREIYRYPPGAQPSLAGEKFCFQLILGFAPLRTEYEEEYVVVPFDAGREVVLPSRPIF